MFKFRVSRQYSQRYLFHMLSNVHRENADFGAWFFKTERALIVQDSSNMLLSRFDQEF